MELVESRPVFRMSKHEIRLIARFLHLLDEADCLDHLCWDYKMSDHEWEELTCFKEGDKSCGDFYDIEIIQ